MYRYLDWDEVIQDGDEWGIPSNPAYNWYKATNSRGYTVRDYDTQVGIEDGFRVRRKITKTKLGNTFT